jgi:hypothetical protein
VFNTIKKYDFIFRYLINVIFFYKKIKNNFLLTEYKGN